MALAEVKTAYESNARQIPEMMHKLADRIAAGEIEASNVLCIVELPTHLTIYGWGDAEAGRHALAAYRVADVLRDMSTKVPEV